MSSDIKQVVAANIRRIREANGMSQTQLAEASGMGVRVVNRLENQPQNLRLETIERIANALGVSVTELTWSGKKKMPPPGRKMIQAIEQVIGLLEAFKKQT
jgi:transcriptional regulator with XRE-family HTH domain